MRLSGSPQPVISFATPQVLEPEEVVEARLRFADVVEKYSDTNDELSAARRALVVAQADDIKEAAAAFAAGKEPKDTTKRERQAQARIDELEGRKRALTRAVDVAGNSFAQAIGEAREEWLPPLQEAEAEAAARYAAAINEALAAATELRVVRAVLVPSVRDRHLAECDRSGERSRSLNWQRDGADAASSARPPLVRAPRFAGGSQAQDRRSALPR